MNRYLVDNLCFFGGLFDVSRLPAKTQISNGCYELPNGHFKLLN